MTTTHEITRLLQAWHNGDGSAFEKLLPLVDRELRKIAHAYMLNERVGHTLQTTAFVNEAMIRFIQAGQPDWHNRRHFYSLVAKRMRQILVEHARKQLTAKRGHRPDRVDLSVADRFSHEEPADLLMLDSVLDKLATLDERKARIVEYRYFGGFTVEEVAEMLEVSPATLEREWRLARAWLKREMSAEV